MAFSAISSPGGTRDLLFDATAVLETGEAISSAGVTTSASFVTISNVAVISTEMTVDGKTVAIGKGVSFSVETTAKANTTATLVVTFTGDQGSADTYDVPLPVMQYLESK